MTNPLNDEARLLVLFGEMRGDVKSLLKAQEDLTARLKEAETGHSDRLGALEKRVGSLEAMRLKVAGFATGLGVIATIVIPNLGGLFSKLATLIGG